MREVTARTNNRSKRKLSAEIVKAMQKHAQDLARSTASLTPRQLQVLPLLCQGLSNKLISQRLKITHGTVKVHMAAILRELGVSNRVQAVMAARAARTAS